MDICEKYGRVGRRMVGLLNHLDKETMFYEKRACRYSYEQEKENTCESMFSKIGEWVRDISSVSLYTRVQL